MKCFQQGNTKSFLFLYAKHETTYCGTQSKDVRHAGKTEGKICDCKKQEYPVNGSCLMENVIYKATAIAENQTKFYVGPTGLSFKNRYTKPSTASNIKNIEMRQLYHSIFGN